MKTSSLALCRIGLAALLLLGVIPAHAIPILVTSTFNSTNRDVRTIIYGKRLTPEPGATIGAFDFSFSYDAKVLQLNQVFFTPLLGSPDKRTYVRNADTLIPGLLGSGEALSFASLTSPDTVRLSDISLLEASADTCSFCAGRYLNNLQSGWVPLVSLTFHGLVPILNVNPDTMGFHLSVLSTSDGHGNPFQSNPVQFSPVPLPPTLALFGIGLLGLLRWRPVRA